MSLPLDGFALTGCDLWVGFDPPVVGGLAHRGGTASLAYSVPNDVTLAGLRLAVQVLSLNPGAPNGVAALSNAGIATLYQEALRRVGPPHLDLAAKVGESSDEPVDGLDLITSVEVPWAEVAKTKRGRGCR